MKKNPLLILGIILLVILLFKNPLAPTSPISDLEPSPDSIHYLNPLVSLLAGKGLVISYQGRTIPTTVPPLYSLTLLPLYLLSGEIRFFYITNVILTIISTILFYKIITALFKNRAIIGILFLGFITNYVIYWYPQTAMAENLLIPTFLFSIWLLLKPLSIRTIFLLSALSVALFATKYVAWILALSLMVVLLIKVLSSKESVNKKSLQVMLALLSLLATFFIYGYIEYLNKGVAIFRSVSDNLQNFLALSADTTAKPSYSKIYFNDNFIRYLAGIVGGPVTVAVKDFIILPVAVGMFSLLTIFVNLFVKKNRLLSFYFFISIAGTLFFISTFHIVDARYLFVFIPAFLLIFGLFLETITHFFHNLQRDIYSYLLLAFVFVAIIFNVYQPVINQLKINFFNPEPSLSFEAVSVMNAYTDTLAANSKPIIISVLSPFYIDFYSNHKYELLPISKTQYFSDNVDKVWGIDPKIEIIEVYKNYLKENRLLLVSAYRTSNKYWYSLDMRKIADEFNLTMVAEGCNGECNLYKLETIY